jgi:hypothetical protein
MGFGRFPKGADGIAPPPSGCWLNRSRTKPPRRVPASAPTDVEATDLETVIQDLLDGQYSQPVRVVSFNLGEGRARDISADVAEELRRRCDLQLREIPSNILDFIERYEAASPRQLTLRLL